MAISASFHRNVFLLNQLIPPSDDFKKHFCEGMFDKPNIAGFIHVSHYLLMIYDAERFKKLVEWPVICKKTEAKYRNDVKEYLNVMSSENPNIGFPHILATYLHHASGTKFTIIMWKLSQLVLRKYLIREGDYNVISMPRLGPTADLSGTYLQQSITKLTHDISSHHRNCIEMEKAANSALVEEKEEMAKIKAELFDRKQSVAKHAAAAPVAASIKQRLTNVEDPEIIQLWKSSLEQSMCYVRKRNAELKNLERICKRINDIVLNLSNDAKMLDGTQLEKIDCSLISELSSPPDIQHCVHHLYSDNKLVYRNFLHLFTFVLCQVYQRLRKGDITDLSQCLLQIEASIEDMSSVRNIFRTFLTSMTSSMEETQNVLCKRNTEYVPMENMLPHVKSVLLMPSPLIKINTHCADEKNDLHKLLQFTPGEVTHRSLFSRYTRHNQNRTPDLRMNLFVSRINVDDTMPSGDNEKRDLNMRFVTPRANQLCKRSTGKYSRLFSAHMNRNVKANYSIMSLPSDVQANSSTIASTMLNSLDLNLDVAAKGFFNLSQDSSLTPVTCTPIKRGRSRDTSQVTEDIERELNYELKVNKPDLDIITETQLVNEENRDTIIKNGSTTRRRSISDLVERYKKLLEDSNHATMKLKNECIEHDIE